MQNKLVKIIVLIVIVVIIVLMVIIKNQSNQYSTTNFFDLNVNENFDKNDYLNKGYPVLLDIGGGQCSSCKVMAPVLEKLNNQLKQKAVIKFIDYWKYSHLASQFDFKVIPTQFFYDEQGNLFKVHEGIITEDGILEIFKEMGYDFYE